MSVSYYLCSTTENQGPVTRWEDNYAIALGTPDHIKNELSAIFPFIQWDYQDEWKGLGSNEKDHIDISFVEEDSMVKLIVLRGGTIPAMRRIMQLFDLNHCSSDMDEIINLNDYDDDFQLAK